MNNVDTPPAASAGPRQGNCTDDAGAGTTGEAEDNGRERPGSRHTGRMDIKNAEAATVPKAHLGAHVPRAAPPTLGDTPRERCP